MDINAVVVVAPFSRRRVRHRHGHDEYCSASIMLGKTAEITTGFDLVDG